MASKSVSFKDHLWGDYSFDYSQGSVNVEVNKDAYAELDEILSFEIVDNSDYESTSQALPVLSIPSNGPRASLSASQSATEGGYGWFDLNLSEPSTGKWQIPYSIASSSTADLGSDYLAPLSVVDSLDYSADRFVYFDSGKTTSGLYVTALQDQIDEPTETVAIELQNQSITDSSGFEFAGYLVDSNPSASLDVLNSGLCPAEVLILAPDRNGATVIRAQEQAGSQQALIRVQLNSQPRENVTISLSSTSGDLAEQSLTFTSKNWASGQTIAVSDLSDSKVTTVTATASSEDSLYNGLSTTQTIVPSDWQEDLIVSLTEGGSQVSSLPSLSVSAVDSSEDNSSGFGFVIKTNRVDHQNDLEIVYQLSTSDPTFQFGGTGLSLYRLFDYTPASGVVGLNTENDDFDYFSVDHSSLNETSEAISDLAIAGSGNMGLRWEGFISIPTTGSYTFKATSNDGVAVTLKEGGSDGSFLDSFDDWDSPGSGTSQTTSGKNLSLNAGDVVWVQYDYYTTADNPNATAQLLWDRPDGSGGTVSNEVIPSTALFLDSSLGDFTDTPTDAIHQPESTNSDGFTVTLPAGAESVSVNLSPVVDSLAEGPETVTLTLVEPSGSNETYALAQKASSATATLSDANAPGFQFLAQSETSDGELSWSPIDDVAIGSASATGSKSATIGVQLTSLPNADVSMTLNQQSYTAADLSISESGSTTGKVKFTFTRENWNVPQVFVVDNQDTSSSANSNQKLSFNISSDDATYDDLDAASFNITIANDATTTTTAPPNPVASSNDPLIATLSAGSVAVIDESPSGSNPEQTTYTISISEEATDDTVVFFGIDPRYSQATLNDVSYTIAAENQLNGLSFHTASGISVDSDGIDETSDSFTDLGLTGDFTATWSGFVYAPENGNYQFIADVTGGVTVEVGGQIVIDQTGDVQGSYSSALISLNQGQYVPLVVTYDSNDNSDPAISLEWVRPDVTGTASDAPAVVPNSYLSRVSDFHVLIPAGETSADVTVTAVDDEFAEDTETWTPTLQFSGGVDLIVSKQSNSATDSSSYTLSLSMSEFDRDSISLPAGTTLQFTNNSYESTDNSSEPIANFVLSSDATINQVGSVDVEGTLTWTSTGEESDYSTSIVGLTAAAPNLGYQLTDSSVTLTLVDDLVADGSAYTATMSFDPSISNLSKFTVAKGSVFNYSIQNGDGSTELFTLTTTEAVKFDQQTTQQNVAVDVSNASSGLDLTTVGQGLTAEYGIPLVSEISIVNDASKGTAGLVFSSDSDGDDLISDGSSVTINEDGGSIQRWVRLNSQPRETVNVYIEVDNAANVSLQQGTAGDGNTGGLIKLAFTPGNWDTYQPFTILANDNDEVDGDTTVSLSTLVSSEDPFYTASNADYQQSPSQSVTVKDDDSAQVLVSIQQIAVAENSNNYLDFSLSAEPLDDVVVTLTPSNKQFSVGDAGVGNAESITFTPTNWNQVQSVELVAIDDDVAEDIVSANLAISTTSADSSFDGLTDPSVEVDIIDNDFPTASLKAATVDGTENAKPGMFVVELSSPAPSSEGYQGVWVNYSISDVDYETGLYEANTAPSDSDIDNFTQVPGALTGKVWIAPGEQSSDVIVVPIDDAVADSQGKSFVVSIADGDGYTASTTDQSASVQITNDDTAGVVIQSTGKLMASEGIIGDPDAVVAGTFDISLLSQPLDPVTITFTTDDADNASMALKTASTPGYASDASTSISADADSPFSIQFTSDNWMTPQAVNLYASNDDEIISTNGGVKPITVDLTYAGDTDYVKLNPSSDSSDSSDSNSAYQSFSASLKDLQFPDSTALSIQNALLSVQDGLESIEAPFVGSLEGKLGKGVHQFLPELYGDLVDTNPTAAQLESILNSVVNAGANTDFSQSIAFADGNANLNVQFGYTNSSELASIPLGSDLGLGPLGFTSTGELDAVFDTTNLVNVIVPVDGTTPYTQTSYSPSSSTGTGASASFNASLEDFEFTGGLGFLQLKGTNQPSVNPNVVNSAGDPLATQLDFDVDVTMAPSSGPTNNVIDNYQYAFSGDAALSVGVETNVAGSAAIPSFGFDFSSLLFSADESNTTNSLYGSTDFYFDDIQMDLGTYITGMMSPIVDSLNGVLEPIYPIVDALYADTHIFSTLGLENVFSDDGVVTTLDLASWFAEATGDQDLVDDINEAEEFIDYIKNFLDLVQDLEQMEQQGDFYVDYGSYTLDAFNPGGDEAPSTNAGDGSDLNSKTQKQAEAGGTSASGASSSVFAGLMQDFYDLGVGIPLIEQPVNVIELLLGQTADLFTLTLPSLALSAEVEEDFPIWGAVEGVVEGGLSTDTNFEFGFDSSGLEAWAKTGFKDSAFGKVFDGFYVVDSDGPEFKLDATMGAGLDLNAVIVDASIVGGLEAGASLDLIDQGEISGTGDGKIYADELLAGFSNPSSLFNVVGDLAAFLQAKVRVGFHLGFIKFMRTVWEQNLAEVPIFEFDVGGTSSNGTASNGHLVGTNIFLDGNRNGAPDAYEPSTVTGDDASFLLKADHNSFDRNNNGQVDADEGRLIAHGGTDSSSDQPLLVPLIAPVGSEMITPLTSLAQAALEQGQSKDEAKRWINEAFELSDFDVYRDDPVLALKGRKPQNVQTNLRAYSAHTALHFSLDVLQQAIKAVTPASSATTLAEQVDLVSTFSSAVVSHSAKRSISTLLRHGFQGVKRDLASCLDRNDRLNLRSAVAAAETAALEFEARLSHKVAQADRKGFGQGELKDLLGGINSLKQNTFDRYRTRFAASGDGLHRIDDPVALRDEIESRLEDVQGNFIKRSLTEPSRDPKPVKQFDVPDVVRGKQANTKKVSLESTDQQSMLVIHQPVSEIKVRLGGNRSILRGKALKDSTVQVALDGESRLISRLPLIRDSVIHAKGGFNSVMDFRGDRLIGVTAQLGSGEDTLVVSSDSSVHQNSQFNLGRGADLAQLDGVIRSGLIDLGYDRDVDRVVLDDRRQIKDELTIRNFGPSDVLQIGEREYSAVDLLSKDLKKLTVSFQDDLFCAN
nr:PA14 domain-containing protein [Synechococcus sp. AH-551-E05]